MPAATQRRRHFGAPASAGVLVTLLLVAACGSATSATPAASIQPTASVPVASPSTEVPSSDVSTPPVATPSPARTDGRPLSGVVIALDPGHQLGNATHPRQIAKRVWVGFWKECNTTGTSTNSGYPEATFTWDVSSRTKRELEALGARVVMTRNANSARLWGPCVDARGRFGAAHDAALEVSIHGDGAPASGRGFHVIEPALLRGYTDDILAPSRRLGTAMKAGLVDGGITPSTYVSGAVSVRKDLGTLTMSDVPTVMVELGNMRNARDAALMTSPSGRQRYADALVSGIRLSLDR